MSPSIQLLLLLETISAARTKYVYVQEKKTWSDAHSHCVTEHTDLAPVNDESDMNLLRELAGSNSEYIWFGLLRNMTDLDKWMWSGGGEVTRFFWDKGQPDPSRDQNYGLLIKYLWHDAKDYFTGFAFCFSVHVVRETKTWEEALEHCRTHHKDLASISSETEMMLIQKELNKGVTTEHVWMGLHFLSGDWFWLDGHIREYEAWGSGDKPQCPGENLACGALVSNRRVWEAHNCEEKLHFICY